MLNHEVLFSKLSRYGIRGVVNDWFRSYLTNRSLIAKVPTSQGKVTYSNAYDITCGTAQGRCLRPLLFIIFCNNIHRLPLYGKFILFANDTTLIYYHKGFLSYSLTHDMELLSDWLKANWLSLYMSKTVAMSFWDNKKNLNVTLGGQKIPLVDTTTFLGITLDSDLSWNSHITQLYNKLQANKHLLSTHQKY